VRRLARVLQHAGCLVWRANLRGAGPSRDTSRGTYAAACNRDLLPLLAALRSRAAGLPLLGVGLSLGGTILMNALLAQADAFDGLACVSSPLDLEACSRQIERPRNRLYASWLLRRLIAQTRADPGWAAAVEADPGLIALPRLRRIRAFDALITAPRWGYGSVEAYYAAASPLPRLRAGAALPPLLLVHALDDPWVPALATRRLAGQSVCTQRTPGCEALPRGSSVALMPVQISRPWELHARSMVLMARDLKDPSIAEQADLLTAILGVTR
jgi:predicted alpha/beta-fold hydrolase